MKEFASLLPLLAILVVFWVLMIRPAQRRNRALAELHDSLAVGDRVMLSSGFYGTLRAVDADTVRIELVDNVVVEVAKGAVARIDRPAPASSEEA